MDNRYVSMEIFKSINTSATTYLPKKKKKIIKPIQVFRPLIFNV